MLKTIFCKKCGTAIAQGELNRPTCPHCGTLASWQKAERRADKQLAKIFAAKVGEKDEEAFLHL